MVRLKRVDSKVGTVKSGGGAKGKGFAGMDLVLFGVHVCRDGGLAFCRGERCESQEGTEMQCRAMVGGEMCRNGGGGINGGEAEWQDVRNQSGGLLSNALPNACRIAANRTSAYGMNSNGVHSTALSRASRN